MTDSLSDVVDILSKALAIVRERTQGKLGITLSKAELELQTVAKREGGVGVQFKYFVDVDISAKRQWNRTHTLTLRLTPTPAKADLGESSETEDLADGIIGLARETKAIRERFSQDFELREFAISLDIGVTKEGKLMVVAGGGGSGERDHQITLTFRPGKSQL